MVDSAAVSKLLNKGIRLGREGHSDRAIACFEEVLQMDDSHILARFYLGQAWEFSGDIYAANRHYLRLIEHAWHYPKICRYVNRFRLAHASLWNDLTDEGRKRLRLVVFQSKFTLSAPFDFLLTTADILVCVASGQSEAAADCLLFDGVAASWEDVYSQFPEGWQPQMMIISDLNRTPLPSDLQEAPYAIFGWAQTDHGYYSKLRQDASACDWVYVSSGESYQHCRKTLPASRVVYVPWGVGRGIVPLAQLPKEAEAYEYDVLCVLGYGVDLAEEGAVYVESILTELMALKRPYTFKVVREQELQGDLPFRVKVIVHVPARAQSHDIPSFIYQAVAKGSLVMALSAHIFESDQPAPFENALKRIWEAENVCVFYDTSTLYPLLMRYLIQESDRLAHVAKARHFLEHAFSLPLNTQKLLGHMLDKMKQGRRKEWRQERDVYKELDGQFYAQLLLDRPNRQALLRLVDRWANLETSTHSLGMVPLNNVVVCLAVFLSSLDPQKDGETFAFWHNVMEDKARRLLAGWPDYAKGYYNVLKSFAQLGTAQRVPEYEEWLNQALSLMCVHISDESFNDEGYLWICPEKTSVIEEHFMQGRSAAYSFLRWSFHSLKAEWMLLDSDSDGAYRHFCLALKEQPHDLNLMIRLGLWELKRGDVARAKELAAKAKFMSCISADAQILSHLCEGGDLSDVDAWADLLSAP